ncbi:hypothetical protein NB231_00230 [Nitrococcus mobilis Nb-231]|uniref:Uncharacterized protein n=1 Tax=Nitrococcus mobilis Nb-231 TaxID=314278 RepID=A4BTK9_9GAMM|nr:hypothetical protein NB231_00230 [Nitrococcus mobilis Nb-231]
MCCTHGDHVLARQTTGQTAQERGAAPPVTVLKPLCGDEPELYTSLYAFCAQNHPAFNSSTVLSDYLVETVVAEPNFAHLWQHEVRWLRTIRRLQP